MTEAKFWEIADSFRDPNVWQKDENGEWVKDNIWDHESGGRLLQIEPATKEAIAAD